MTLEVLASTTKSKSNKTAGPSGVIVEMQKASSEREREIFIWKFIPDYQRKK